MKLKEILKKEVYWYILTAIIILIYLFAPLIGNFVYNKDPKYCGQYKFLYDLAREDNYESSCFFNCGLRYGCNHSYNNVTHFNHTTMICNCDNQFIIDYDLDDYTIAALPEFLNENKT